jgi:hypothetical protein
LLKSDSVERLGSTWLMSRRCGPDKALQLREFDRFGQAIGCAGQEQILAAALGAVWQYGDYPNRELLWALPRNL